MNQPTILTNEEQDILFNKATQRAFVGEYTDTLTDGVYICKNCNTKLYRSQDKFHSGCGWPSFDLAIDNNVREVDDSDGHRIEILCNHCGVHLGHVFRGEELTTQDTRYCVNSLSMKLIKSQDTDSISTFKSLVVGCGCFWGVQYWFDRLEGVIRTQVGYSGGSITNPTYRQVSSHKSGHMEVILIDYDPSITNEEKILKYFFEIHDFEQTDGQGNDIGQQYESVIFGESGTLSVAKNIITNLENRRFKVATKLLPLAPFWTAEIDHQKYYKNNGHTPYCHIYKKIF